MKFQKVAYSCLTCGKLFVLSIRINSSFVFWLLRKLLFRVEIFRFLTMKQTLMILLASTERISLLTGSTALSQQLITYWLPQKSSWSWFPISRTLQISTLPFPAAALPWALRSDWWDHWWNSLAEIFGIFLPRCLSKSKKGLVFWICR